MLRRHTLGLTTFKDVSRPLTRNFSASVARNKQNLVILGSGWGGYEVLRKVDKKRWNVTLISPTNYFNFTPLLASCSVGTLEFRCAIEPVRRYSPSARIYEAWCDKVDFKRKTVQCMPATPPLAFEHKSAPKADPTLTTYPGTGTPFDIKYDRLVIAVGCYSQTFGIPGVKEHAHFLKDVKDARMIRTRILECFEQANQPILTDVQRRNLLHFAIVGGGPTGVEFAAELHDLLHTDIAKHYPNLARFAKISLYDVAPNILGSFDSGLAEYAEKKFKRDGITLMTSHHVERVESGRMFIKEKGEVPFGLLVWSTGLAPNPLIETISPEEYKKHPKTGSLFTDDNLNILRADGTPDPDVWGIGDAAMIEGVALPATAQVANQKAMYLHKKLNTIVKDKEHITPFEFHNKGTLAYLGDWKAIYDRSHAESGPQTKETGRIAWLLWRSAYFTMTVSLRNKILIPIYWFLNWIFGRDLTRF
ncbi:FAD/NAD-P-binding domain-containing protein [Stereum hirsutum FP-91666 SS1]|uniref:FAD/NAD-P-binding domain-containing protein n=1 Tax=Stereum hirsutum (strain FP-91666) TaxID=721885 RepID=UPI000440AF4D|nr:FAD/NAD-P-binding domain-containing protein [Stereum hirsutum FP-91666 SS1]EIM87464.1 FAD/NAD-P-binding domain-containing protein [Stereum hirsutum FP-91666 SS1]